MRHAAKDKLIVALDVASASRALDLFAELRDIAGMFKIGSQLFTAAGPDVVRQIISKGGHIFLDLKYHDIPNTVAAAGGGASPPGGSIVNLHPSRGAENLKRMIAALNECPGDGRLPKPKRHPFTSLNT